MKGGTLRGVVRTLVYLWVLPTTAVGLVVFLLAAMTRGRARVVAGVLEVHGGAASWVLRYLARGASAMTLGHVVLGRDATALEWSRSHERVHVRQCERWGPLFLPAYGVASVVAMLRGGRAYWDNAFEKEAYEEDGRG